MKNDVKKFLDDNNVDYKEVEDGSFVLWYGNPNGKRSYQIRYVDAKDYPIAYPNYGIEGVEKDYFFRKSYEAENNNSFILWVKSFEWENDRQREVLKSYILHAAHKTPNSFYARNCIVSKVDSKEARRFEAENCFYGKRGASLNLGLYLKKEINGLPANTLIMLYTFGKNFFGKNDDVIEVIRVGTLRFAHVVGGSSKLLSYFIKHYKMIRIGKHTIKVKKILFYSDYDHNIGGSMDKVGFEFVSYSEGGFMNYWIEERKIKNREPMHHKKVMEQMRNGEVIAIPNAGVKTFLITLPDYEPVNRVGIWFK